MRNAMKESSPLKPDEVFFTNRLLFETLNFSEPIEITAEPKFRKLGLENGAIENFLRVMWLCKYPMLKKIYGHEHEPPTVGFCPWETQGTFLQRAAELQGWLRDHGGSPCSIEPFIHERR
jgi:hypothetical protein